MTIIVAIDGPAAAGKGTLAKSIAKEYGLPHLDTGSLYRAAASRMIELDIGPVVAARTLVPSDFARADLRSALVSQEASRISAISDVRKELDDYQFFFAKQSCGAILDGRDIGTSIAPHADVKIFMTASTESRSARRFAEMQNAGIETTLEEVTSEMRIRDERDSTRSVSPLKPADDAILLDTSDLTTAEVIDHVFTVVDIALMKKRAVS